MLLVDDNDDVRQMLRAILTLEDHEVYEAGTGAAGLATAEKISPDVIVLDIGLPDLDGYELARRLRAGPHGHAMVLIALSGYGENIRRGTTKAAGLDAHLVKPAGVEQILDVINGLVNRSRAIIT